MSSIEKLLVRGIRSFSPDEPAVIEFYSPVTLLVGHNGAGKTTVIECLKYATTGDLPPNSKGGAFVHDCKLYGGSEVKAQVKLKFRNVRHQPMIVTRSLQLTAKGARTECKTLEGVLTTTDPHSGEQISLSSRVADLDLEVPLNLGVSSAVLDNVIFCHQEDSLWPLAEPSVLKKKFDDIFAATKYTKALDTLKALRKQLMLDLKLEQQRLDQLRTDKDKAHRIRSQLEQTTSNLDVANERIHALQEHIDACVISMSTLAEDLRAAGAVAGDLERAQHEAQMLANAINELRQSGMREMTDIDDEKLGQLWEQHAHVVESATSRQAAIKERKDTIVQAMARMNSERNALQIQVGTHSATLEKVESDWKAFASKHGLFEMTQLADFLQSQQSAVAALEQEVKRADETYQALQRQLSLESSQMHAKKASLEECRKTAKRQQDDLKLKLSDLMKREEQCMGQSTNKTELESVLQTEEQLARRLEVEVVNTNYDVAVQDLQRRKRVHEESIQEATATLAKSGKTVDLRARITLKQDEVGKRGEVIGKLFGELQTEAASLNVHELIVDTCDRTVEAVWKEKETASRIISVQELDLQGQMSRLSSEIASKRAELEAAEQSQASIDCPRDLSKRIEDLEDRLHAVYAQKSSQLAVTELYESFIHAMEIGHNCAVCERAFATRMEAEQAITRARHQLSERSSKSTVASDRKLLEAELDALKAQRPILEKFSALQASIPALQTHLAQLREQLEQTRAKLDELHSQKANVQLEERKLSAIRKRADDVARQHRELKVASNQLMALRSELELEMGAADDDESFEQIQRRIAQEQEGARQLQLQIDQILHEQRTKLADLSKRQMRCQDLKAQILTIQMMSSEIATVQAQIHDAEAALSRLEADVHRFDQDIPQLSARIEAHDSEAQMHLITEKSALDDLKHHHQQCLNDVNILTLEARAFEDNDRRQALRESLLRLGEKVRSVEESMQQHQDELNLQQEQLLSHGKESAELEMTLRQIRDNQRLREMESKRRMLEHKLDELRGAVRDRNRQDLSSAYQRAQMRHSDLLGERSGLLGELKQLEDQQARYRHELQVDYPDIDNVFRLQYAKCFATQLAGEDLDRYGKSLDTAIMRYHATKMDEINRIIRELWTSTYQGADIDTIEIRADAEKPATASTTTSTTNRSYNYRVVMLVKGGERELDMRGRSSAGQRVLASLIIRLALAETFALQCGVLALDEPTTNLDRDNIEALANALGELVKSRKRQANFQLLIITHDEEFVSMLGRHELADYYWRIDKDDHQHSVIHRESIQSF